MIPGWEDIICQIEVMALGLVSEGFLIEPAELLLLVLHGILWDLPRGGGYGLADIPGGY